MRWFIGDRVLPAPITGLWSFGVRTDRQQFLAFYPDKTAAPKSFGAAANYFFVLNKSTLISLQLGSTEDYLRRGFAHFKPGAHFLDLRGLVLELRRENFHPFLLLGDDCFLLCHCGL